MRALGDSSQVSRLASVWPQNNISIDFTRLYKLHCRDSIVFERWSFR